MSDIQTTINNHLSKDGGELRTIVVNNGSGSANLPPNCYLHLRKCSIGSITIGSGCVVVIEESTLGSLNASSGSVTLDRVQVSGGISVDSVKISSKLCSFQSTVNMTNGSNLDSYKCDRKGSGTAITMKSNCRAVLREDSIIGCEIGVEMDDGCFVSSRNSKIVVVLKGIYGKNSCQAEVIGGTLNGEEGFCLDLEGSSSGFLSGIDKNLVANRAAISLKSSTTRMANCKGINSVEFGVIAEENSSITIHNFDTLKTASDAVFKLESGSTAEISKGTSVFSSGNDTVLLRESSFIARKIEKIYSSAKNAFFSQGDSTVVLDTITTEVRGYGNRAIEAQNNDNYSLSRIPLIQGDSAEAVKLGNDSQLSCFDVKKIIGDSSHGIETGNNCKVTLKKIDNVIGMVGHGINAGNSTTVTCSEVKEIKGMEGDGIHTGFNSVIRYSNGELIHGLMLNGIAAGSNSDIEVKNFNKIVGEKEDGIDAPSSLVVATDGKKILGQILNGIDVSGKGGKIIVRRVDEIFGVESDGFRLHKGEADARDFGAIKGGISGINATSSVVVVERGEMVKGWMAGMRAGDSTRAVLSGLDLLYGAGEGAVNARDSSVEVLSVKLVEAAPFAIDSLNSKVSIKQCEISGGILAEDSSSVFLDRCTLSGKSIQIRDSEYSSLQCEKTADAEISGSSVSMVNSKLTGSIISDESEFDLRKVIITNTVALTGCSIKSSNTNFQGAMSFTEVGGLFAKCTGIGLSLVNSGVVSSLSDFVPVLVASGYINIDAVKTFVTHELLVELLADEVLTNTT